MPFLLLRPGSNLFSRVESGLSVLSALPVFPVLSALSVFPVLSVFHVLSALSVFPVLSVFLVLSVQPFSPVLSVFPVLSSLSVLPVFSFFPCRFAVSAFSFSSILLFFHVIRILCTPHSAFSFRPLPFRTLSPAFLLFIRPYHT